MLYGRHALRSTFFLRLFHGNLPALGTGHVDHALSPRDTQNGAAMLAFEIAVCFAVAPFVLAQCKKALDLRFDTPIDLCLASALADVPRIRPKDRPHKQRHRYEHQKEHMRKTRKQRQHQCRDQQHEIQFVVSVTTVHHARIAFSHSAKPIFHIFITLPFALSLYHTFFN